MTIDLKVGAAPVDKSEERVRRMFGEIAPNYDRMNHLLSMNVDRYWRWRTVRHLAPSPGASILDNCTGTGDLALAFFRRTHGLVPIVGSDFCEEMLEIGREKSARAGARDQITFVRADAHSLPFADNEFQIVSVAFGLRNIADTDLGLREMVRVCRPGGKVAILEFSMPRRQPVKAAYQWYFKNILPRIGQRLAKNNSDAYNYLSESVSEFPSYEHLVIRMLAAGLTRAYYKPLTFGIATLYVGFK